MQLTSHTTAIGAICLLAIIVGMFIPHPALMLFIIMATLLAFASSIYDFAHNKRKINLLNGLCWLGVSIIEFLVFMHDFIV